VAVARSLFTWNAGAKRYRDARGRFVPRETVRRAIDTAIDGTRLEMLAASEALRAGGSLDVWLVQMREAVKDANLYSAAAARGGWAQMTPADFGRVGRAVRDQYAYLDRFAADIADGLTLDGGFLYRASTYAASGRKLYHAIERDEMLELGAVQEHNVEDPSAEHCTGANSCEAETARGWVAVGALKPIGERKCRGGCKCRIEYRDEAGEIL
jgi:hypothetical protein